MGELVLKEIQSNDARFILHPGDLGYGEGRTYVWDQWHSIIEPTSTRVPYQVTIGNHEYDHTGTGGKDPSGAPPPGFHPTWGDYGDDSYGECGVPTNARFKS